MQPVAVTSDETTTWCCAGVRVFLTDPSDPTLVFTAQVSTEGSPFTARNVTREGDVVYVQGLQAGTLYNIRLTAWNNFGSVTKEVSTTPVIGEIHIGRASHVFVVWFCTLTLGLLSQTILERPFLQPCLTSFISIIFLLSSLFL